MLIPSTVVKSGLTVACDPEHSRCALGGVRVERDERGPVAVVTDGRRVLAVRWPENGEHAEYPAGLDAAPRPGFPGALIPMKAWIEAGRLPPAKTPKPVLHNVVLEEAGLEAGPDAEVSLGATDLETTRRIQVKQIDGRFPRWRECVREYAPHEAATIKVNAKWLGELLGVFVRLTEAGNHEVALTIPLDADCWAPLVAKSVAPDGIETTAVQMPIGKEHQPGESPSQKARREFFESGVISNDVEARVVADVCSAAQLAEITRRLLPPEPEPARSRPRKVKGAPA